MENKNSATLLDILVVFVISTSIISISSLILNIFRVNISIILSLIITLLIFWIKNKKWKIDVDIKSTHVIPIILLLLIGLLFRSEPYHYIAGGQDQGVYVNMSQYYQKYGKIFIIDELRESLTDELKGAYDSANLSIGVSVKHQNEGLYLPGVFIKDLQSSEYVFQFYPLHPLWMSISGKLFGDTNRVYSLVFFSLISIVAFYLLAFEFTKRKNIAFSAGFLLAINPLHAFFSKFPVTEVVALAFTSLSFYYLLKYYNLAKEQVYFPVYLALSSLLISGMFFTRISGFMYIPFFYLMIIIVDVFSDDKTQVKQLRYYIFSVFFLYALSVWYGLIFSYPYSSYIYSSSFQRLLGINWHGWLALLIGFSVFCYIVILYAVKLKYKDKLKYYLSSLRSFIPYIFVIIFCLGIYKVYQLGFTEKYIDNQWYDNMWNAAGSGWMAPAYWSFVVITEHLSPFIVVVFSYIVFSQVKTNNISRTLLVLFILIFFIHISLLQWFIPYQYYYARYLLSETLPFILLFTVIGLDGIKRYKKIAHIFIGLSVIYMLFLTILQFRVKEMRGLHASLSEIKKDVGENDVLILDERYLRFSGEIKTTLKFYYHYNVLTVNRNHKEQFINYFCSQNKNVFFLNSSPADMHENQLRVINLKAERHRRITMVIVHNSRDYFLSGISCSHMLSTK